MAGKPTKTQVISHIAVALLFAMSSLEATSSSNPSGRASAAGSVAFPAAESSQQQSVAPTQRSTESEVDSCKPPRGPSRTPSQARAQSSKRGAASQYPESDDWIETTMDFPRYKEMMGQQPRRNTPGTACPVNPAGWRGRWHPVSPSGWRGRPQYPYQDKAALPAGGRPKVQTPEEVGKDHKSVHIPH